MHMTQEQQEYLKALRGLSPAYDGIVPADTLMVHIAFGNQRFMEVHKSLLDLEYVILNDLGIVLLAEGRRALAHVET